MRYFQSNKIFSGGRIEVSSGGVQILEQLRFSHLGSA